MLFLHKTSNETKDGSKKTKMRGGAALEYLLVSLFAAFISMVFLGVVSKVAKKKLDVILNKVDPDTAQDFDLNLLEDD